MKAQDKIRLGLVGQKVVENYLSDCGFQIIERNFTCRWGEIDLIAIDKATLVFIEVRTKTTNHFLTPLESITPRKLRTIARAGKYYSLLHPRLPRSLRLDCVGVEINKGGRLEKIDLRQNCYAE